MMEDHTEFLLGEMRQMIARGRLNFMRMALPIAGTDDALLELARRLAAAIGEVSPDEAMTAFLREVDARKVG